MKYLKKYKIFDSIDVFRSIKRHDIDAIKNIDKKELSIFSNENTPLMYAIMQSDDMMVSLLIDKTENINYQDFYTENALSTILYAKPTKRVKILNILLTSDDLDINCIYEYNQNILMRCFYELKSPSIPDFGDDENALILNLPKKYTKKEKDNNDSLYDMIIILIKKGCDITHKSNDNLTFIDIIKKDKYLINRIKNECPIEYSQYERKMKAKKFNL
jgi:ankyrin repeat protein